MLLFFYHGDFKMNNNKIYNITVLEPNKILLHNVSKNITFTLTWNYTPETLSKFLALFN